MENIEINYQENINFENLKSLKKINLGLEEINQINKTGKFLQ